MIRPNLRMSRLRLRTDHFNAAHSAKHHKRLPFSPPPTSLKDPSRKKPCKGQNAKETKFMCVRDAVFAHELIRHHEILGGKDYEQILLSGGEPFQRGEGTLQILSSLSLLPKQSLSLVLTCLYHLP